jgi:hypothetical protein
VNITKKFVQVTKQLGAGSKGILVYITKQFGCSNQSDLVTMPKRVTPNYLVILTKVFGGLIFTK